jgi:hypothetical protein
MLDHARPGVWAHDPLFAGANLFGLGTIRAEVTPCVLLSFGLPPGR